MSLFLTLGAYLLVHYQLYSKNILITMIVGLALVQFLVQLLFFMHLGTEQKPRWRLAVFLFMLIVVLILIFGSLWIMQNLNYRMTPQTMNMYLSNQDNL